ncbi:MAG: primosomal protein N' family DNA-binding protein, partial [Hyphococcus sp.]
MAAENKAGESSLATAELPLARVKVLFPLPLPKAFDYQAPVDAARPGAFVVAPFGAREARGVIWPGAPDDIASDKVKPIIRVCDGPPLGADVIDFIQWAAQYTMFPLGAVLRMVMRSGDFIEAPSPQTGYVAAGAEPSRMTPQRAAVLRAAGDAALTARMLAEKAGVSDGVVRALAKAGALRGVSLDPDPPFPAPQADRPGRSLSAVQQRAAQSLIDVINAGTGGATLIDGVTGSGKTEVYLEAVGAALRRDPAAQVLILLPEIALTLPFLQRVEERFAAAPAPWHSDMTAAQRRRTWRRVAEGQARIVVGARSALFLPYRNLQLIVVDEEHDAAYKQEEGVIYHARDLAVA